MINKMIIELKNRDNIFYRMASLTYLNTILRFRKGRRFVRQQYLRELSKLEKLRIENLLRMGEFRENGDYFLRMPNRILLFYNYRDQQLIMGDGQSQEFIRDQEDDPLWNAIRQLSSPKGKYLDVGANNGYFYALRVAKEFPKKQVLAFEPSPKILTHLKKNVEVNELANIRIEEVALSSVGGVASLAADLGASGYIAKGEVEKRGWLNIPTITLDQFLKSEEIASIELVKVDIEGWEQHFLMGAGGLLKRGQAIFILEFKEKFLNRAGGSQKEIQDLFDAHSYTCFQFKEKDEIICFPKRKRKLAERLEGVQLVPLKERN